MSEIERLKEENERLSWKIGTINANHADEIARLKRELEEEKKKFTDLLRASQTHSELTQERDELRVRVGKAEALITEITLRDAGDGEASLEHEDAMRIVDYRINLRKELSK